MAVEEEPMEGIENKIPLLDNCSRAEGEDETIWIESTFTKVLNEHARPMQVTPFSK
jgi:hypothetical protein